MDCGRGLQAKINPFLPTLLMMMVFNHSIKTNCPLEGSRAIQQAISCILGCWAPAAIIMGLSLGGQAAGMYHLGSGQEAQSDSRLALSGDCEVEPGLNQAQVQGSPFQQGSIPRC